MLTDNGSNVTKRMQEMIVCFTPEVPFAERLDYSNNMVLSWLVRAELVTPKTHILTAQGEAVKERLQQQHNMKSTNTNSVKRTSAFPGVQKNLKHNEPQTAVKKKANKDIESRTDRAETALHLIENCFYYTPKDRADKTIVRLDNAMERLKRKYKNAYIG